MVVAEARASEVAKAALLQGDAPDAVDASTDDNNIDDGGEIELPPNEQPPSDILSDDSDDIEDSNDEPEDEEERPQQDLEQDIPKQAEAASLLLTMAHAGEQSAERRRCSVS